MKVDDALDDFRRREIALDGVAKQVSFIRFSGHLQFLVTRVIVSLLEPNTRAEVRKHDAT